MASDRGETLENLLKYFKYDVRWASLMRETLEQDGFELTHARRAGPGSWLLRAKPPRALQEGFGLAPEILLVAVQGEVQSRDLQRAADEVVGSDLRLDSNLLIVTDDLNHPLQQRLNLIPGRGQRVAWTWNENQWPPLSETLRQQLPTYDIFDERLPVRGYQLMGREAEVMNLRTRIARGEAVGVFGLRKMGKTSLARAVTDTLDPASGLKNPDANPTQSQACVLWIDAEALDQANVNDVADEILAALKRRMRTASIRYKAPTQRGIAGLKLAGEALLDAGARLCFVIDEYDFLFEREGGLGPVPGLSRLFRLLRAWAQQWQGFVSLILIGRDPEHLSTPQLDGVSNPLLAWFTPMWLGPLVPPRDMELLVKLGSRVGLDVGHNTFKLAHKWTGGHPMLHRQFGSALREEIRLRVPESTWKVPSDPYCGEAMVRFRDRDAVLTVNREIIDLLKKRYEDAYDLLLDLVQRDSMAAAVTQSSASHISGTRTLRNFGLLDETTLSLPEHLSWYVKTLLPRTESVAV
jgi:AAA domain